MNASCEKRGIIRDRGIGDETREIDNPITKKREVVHTFGWYMSKYIADTRAKGATPIAKVYEATGPEESKKAFVHYAADTFPGQDKPLKDDTHFNNYGAYELAKCVVEGIRAAKLPLAEQIAEDVKPFDSSKPDPVDTFDLPASPLRPTVTPAGS